MIIFNKLDNYFVVSADSQTFLGFEMTANFRDTSPLTWLNGNISFTFQAIQKLYTHPVNLCCGVFCEFLDDFWVYLGGDSFSRRIGKIKRNQKY